MRKTTRYALQGLALAAALAGAHVPTIAAAETLATVNGQTITPVLVEAYAKRRPKEGGEVSQEVLVGELVAQELLVQEALKQGLEKDEKLQAELEVMRRGLLAGRAVQSYLAAHPISDEALQKEYEVLAPRMSTTEFKARHILVKTEDEAKAIIKELDGGADFAELAKSKSTGPSGKSGGDLGWFAANQMVKPFADAVAVMEKGKYSAQPVQTQFGWHVILLEDSRTTPAPALDDIRDQLTEFLQQRATQEWLNELRAKAKIELGGS